MGHSHKHNHSNNLNNLHNLHDHGTLTGKNLAIAIFLNIGITIAQAIGGLLSGSLSLLSDALHNFSDVISLIVSYIANVLSKKEASTSKTFGYKRAEIIAAFINASTLVIVAVFLSIEAVKRFANPEPIGSIMVIVMATLGILANGFSVLLLKKEADANMNMKSAYLHLLTDMMASVAVLVGGILMYFFNWYWVDSVLTLAIAIYLIYAGYDLLKESTAVLLLFAPKAVDVEKVIAHMSKDTRIHTIHHVHFWQLNDSEFHFEAHIDFKEDFTLSVFDSYISVLEEELFHTFGINHINIQPEFGKCKDTKLIAQD